MAVLCGLSVGVTMRGVEATTKITCQIGTNLVLELVLVLYEY